MNDFDVNAGVAEFAEAMAALGRKGVRPSAMRTADWARVGVAVRERAFFSAGVESAEFLQKARRFLGDYMGGVRDPEHGGLKATGRAEFVAQMREFAIKEGLGRVDPETGRIDPEIREDDLRDLRSLRRLQLIFDTQVESAQEHGRWLQGLDPDVLQVFPAQRFVRVRPAAAPRPYHAAAEGEVRLKTDLDFWLSMNRDFGVPWGPWGFNSGMGVEDVDREEAEALGLLGPDDDVRPADAGAGRFEFNGGVSASTRRMDGDVLAALEKALGRKAAAGRIGMGSQRKETRDQKPDAGGVAPVGEALGTVAGNTADDDALLRGVIDAVERVHGAAGLKGAKVCFVPGDTGKYRAGRIEIGRDGGMRRQQLAHELGHMLEAEGLDGAAGREGGGLIGEVLAAMRGTKGAGKLARTETFGDAEREKYLSELLGAREMWARGYAQFVAEESGEAAMLAELARRQRGDGAGVWPHTAWTRADFRPVRLAIRGLFEKLGWMNKKGA